jgi:pyroglutamyl-peptidase
MRVVLTAFGPFPGAPFNPTAPLVKALVRRRRPALAGINIKTHVFATAYAAVDRELPKLFAARPDIVLLFGLAGRTRHVRIETRARNAVSLLFPDARGWRPRHGAIVLGGPASLRGRTPFVRLVSAARGHCVTIRTSRDAGRYLCNYAYWRALEQAPSGALVQFVHVPQVSTHRRPLRHSRRHSVSLAQLAAASEAILIALAAARRNSVQLR